MLTVVTDFPTPPFWFETTMARAGRPGFAPSLSATGVVSNSFMRRIMHIFTFTHQGKNDWCVTILNVSINGHYYTHTFSLSFGHTVDVPMFLWFGCMVCGCLFSNFAFIYLQFTHIHTKSLVLAYIHLAYAPIVLSAFAPMRVVPLKILPQRCPQNYLKEQKRRRAMNDSRLRGDPEMGQGRASPMQRSALNPGSLGASQADRRIQKQRTKISNGT